MIRTQVRRLLYSAIKKKTKLVSPSITTSWLPVCYTWGSGAVTGHTTIKNQTCFSIMLYYSSGLWPVYQWSSLLLGHYSIAHLVWTLEIEITVGEELACPISIRIISMTFPGDSCRTSRHCLFLGYVRKLISSIIPSPNDGGVYAMTRAIMAI